MSHTLPTFRLNKPVPACALVLLLPCFAHAASVDEHRPANPQGAVEIDNVAGSIDVQGWDKSEVAVGGTIGKDVERVDVTGDANRNAIHVILPRRRNGGVRDGPEH